MSGIEVVGIILGVVPLIISTIQHFDKAASYWGPLATSDTGYNNIWNEVENEKLLYHQQLRKLLTPLVGSGILKSNELEALVLDPERDLTNGAHMDDAIKQRLGATYKRYLEVITEVQVLSGRLLKWLPPEIAEAPQPGQIDVSNVNHTEEASS